MNRMSSSSNFIILLSCLCCFFHFTLLCAGEESCRLDDPFNSSCGENFECSQEKDNSGVCKCSDGYKLENEKCVHIPIPTEAPYYDDSSAISGGSSIAVWILVPCLILILAGAIFFMIKRLKLVEKLYQFRVRRYNTVFVTSLQDDDAPIS